MIEYAFATPPRVAHWHEEVAARPAMLRAIERVNAIIPQA